MAEPDIYKNLPDQSVLHSKMLQAATGASVAPAIEAASPEGDMETPAKKPMHPLLKLLSWIGSIISFIVAVLGKILVSQMGVYMLAVGLILGPSALLWWIGKKVIPPIAQIRTLLFAVTIHASIGVLSLVLLLVMTDEMVGGSGSRWELIGQTVILILLTTWLIVRPGYYSVIAATLFHVLLTGLFVYTLFDDTVDSLSGELANFTCRVLAVGLLWNGLRENRRSARIA